MRNLFPTPQTSNLDPSAYADCWIVPWPSNAKKSSGVEIDKQGLTRLSGFAKAWLKEFQVQFKSLTSNSNGRQLKSLSEA